jgi:molybdate transport system substrate-binding protein
MPGVRVVGPLPGAAAVTTVFSGAVLRASHQAERAAAALGLLGSPGMEETVRSHGMGSVPA